MNTMPFVVSLSADATRANYDAGHFATVAESFDYGGGANGWLEWAQQVSATCCYVGMYNGCFVLAERGLYFLCELHFAEGWRSGEPAAAARRGAGCSARWRAREGSTASSTRASCSRAPPCRTHHRHGHGGLLRGGVRAAQVRGAGAAAAVRVAGRGAGAAAAYRVAGRQGRRCAASISGCRRGSTATRATAARRRSRSGRCAYRPSSRSTRWAGWRCSACWWTSARRCAAEGRRRRR